jgi:hypothetical protein
MVSCDGSVHSITYDIDPATHRALAHRFDGETVSTSGLYGAFARVCFEPMNTRRILS